MLSAAGPERRPEYIAALHAGIDSFLAGCLKPALLEPGEKVMDLCTGCFEITENAGRLRMEAWDETRNVGRRILEITIKRRGRLDLRTEHFGGKTGVLSLIDLAAPSNASAEGRGSRQAFREVFRRMLRRQFTGFSILEVSSEPDLEHSLSPAFPRALLRRGSIWLAAVAAGPDNSGTDGVLTFGLIWLDYLRRIRRLPVQRLILFVLADQHRNTCLRLRYIDASRAACEVYAYSDKGEARLDIADAGNLDTRLDPCRRAGNLDNTALHRLSLIPGVETIDQGDGSLSLRVRGIEFARWPDENIRLDETARIAESLSAVRSPDSADRHHPLFRRSPELWLESRVRSHLRKIDASLLAAPIHGQVPAFTAGDRGIIDLLAVDNSGRLAVLELKASEDIHLPLQALDYWIRVKHHLEAGEFSSRGYFPGITLRPEPPRLMLIAPSLHFHPANETVLRYLSSDVQVERIGLGVEWQRDVKVMFRMNACL